MISFTKRELVKAGAFLGLGSISSKSSLAEDAISSEVIRENRAALAVVFDYWVNSGRPAPEGYLNGIGVDNLNDMNRIRSLIKADYRAHNCCHIRGLVLSETETAILALLGKKYSALA